MATILLVEDDPDIRETLAEILQYERYTVLTARNGREGLSILASLRTLPDVVVLDLRMPVMDGREFRLSLLAHTEWQSLPVVICSGTPDYCALAELEPLAAKLIKPIEIPELLEALTACCTSPSEVTACSSESYRRGSDSRMAA